MLLDLPESLQMEDRCAQLEEGYRLILAGLGVDLEGTHFADTPRRAAKAMFYELCRGLTHDGPTITKFEYADESPQMIVLRDIPVLSLCAHHLLPFIGTAVVGYIPKKEGKIFGVSKLSRMVDHCARKPQVQEVLTNDVANMVAAELEIGELPDTGVGVFITANHMCMALRGVRHNGDMVTSALRGCFNEGAVRTEFLNLSRR